MLRPRVPALTLAALCLVLAVPQAATGQTIRGVVVDQTDRPVAGIVVQLLDTASAITGRALSNESGEFRLSTAKAGSYRVRTMRIGYRPVTSAAIDLEKGADITQRLVFTGIPFALDTVKVASRTVCRMSTDSAAATFAVWEQVRTALNATQLTGAARNVAATTVVYERTLDKGGRRVLKQSSSLSSDYVTQPWRTLPLDSLRRGGYVITEGSDGGATFFAPGLDMLVSTAFIDDHCFRLASSKDTSRVGIAFEPTSERRKISEIKGTLWLDRKSNQLRSMEFRYVNIPSEFDLESGGEMDFAAMRNGTWSISRWNIRMPVIARAIRRAAMGGDQLYVAEIQVSGGELALARRGADTLWSRPPLQLNGSVVDSVSGNGVAGARVSLAGTELTATTDTRGRFVMNGVLPGTYTMEVRTPSLDSASTAYQSPLSFTDGTTPVELRLPSAAQILGSICGSARLSYPGVIIGTLSLRGDSLPPKNAKVSAEWVDLSVQSAGNGISTAASRRALETRSAANGTFRLCGVPVNTALTITAESDTALNAVAEPVQARIAPNGRFARAEFTFARRASRVATLVGAVFADSSKTPIPGVEVLLPDLNRSGTTNARGEFRLQDIPVGTHRVQVRRFGFSPIDTPLSFANNETVERTIYLNRVISLDSVKVLGMRPELRDFEDNRKLGLGHFWTRDALAPYAGSHLAGVIKLTPGVGIVGAQGRGNHGYIVSSKAPPRFGIVPQGTNNNTNALAQAEALCKSMGYYWPDAAEHLRGAECGCYAQVVVDGHLMNPSHPTEPFDINTISPDGIEAMEFYATPAQLPLKYSRFNVTCGILIVHTRR